MTFSVQQVYSIKDLENFTQIKAHTIRIWEQRYALLNPERTDSNVRVYNETDLKKILNIKLLYANGFKISKIAALKEEEVITYAKHLIETSGRHKQDKWINESILMILEFDVKRLSDFLTNEFANSDIMSIYLNKVIPLLSTLGELWQVNSIGIAHEHFFSNIFKEFVFREIENLPQVPVSHKKAVLFLHAEEEHEFSILMYYYLLKQAGYTCYYFGPKTPINEIEEVQVQLNPKFVVTTFTAHVTEKHFEKMKDVLARIGQNSTVLISGSQLNRMEITYPENVIVVKSTDDLYALIEEVV